MVSLTVLCEGLTEKNFVINVLSPHLNVFNVYAKTIDLNGGMTWGEFKKELNRAFQQRRDHEWVTTMLDLYKMMRVPDCPKLEEMDSLGKAKQLEKSMAKVFPNPRFVPYIQVHEFETLLYVDLNKLVVAFPDGEAIRAIRVLQSDTKDCRPEEINGNEATAPSKRLIRELPEYKARKSTAGPQVVQHIGLPAIRAVCPHFNDWVSRLEGLTP